jgi:hypothetical protein
MTNCPKFAEMKKMFHGKSMTVTKVQHIVKTQIVIADVNVMDVNVTTRSKIIEKHVFKDKKLRKAKECCRLKKKKWLKKSMVETIQQIQKTQNLDKRATHIHGRMEHNLAGYAKYVATLTLGSRPKQRLARMRNKRETQEAHLIFLGL